MVNVHPGETPVDFIARADSALYQAKITVGIEPVVTHREWEFEYETRISYAAGTLRFSI